MQHASCAYTAISTQVEANIENDVDAPPEDEQVRKTPYDMSSHQHHILMTCRGRHGKGNAWATTQQDNLACRVTR